MKLLQRIFRIWDYKNASVRRKTLGFTLVKKRNTHTLLFLALPLLQRKRYITKNIYGGGGGLKLSITHIDSAGFYATKHTTTNA